MPKLPSLSGAQLIKILESFGFIAIRQRGSHVIMRNSNSVCVVPLHNPIKVGTLRSVLRQSGINTDEFLSAYLNS